MLDVRTLKDIFLLFPLDKTPRGSYLLSMPYTSLEDNAILQVYHSSTEDFVGIIRRSTGAAISTLGGIASTGAHILADQGQVLADGIQEVYADGTQLKILNDGISVFIVTGTHSLAAITGTTGWIVDVAGSGWGWIEFHGRWVLDGGSALLGFRSGPPNPVQPPGMIEEYQGDIWPPEDLVPGELSWVDVMISDGFLAWSACPWAFLSQSTNIATQSIVTWNDSGGFRVNIGDWTALEGREPIVSAENTLDSIPIPWRLLQQSGNKYLQALVRRVPSSDDVGFFLPRNGLGKPTGSTLSPLSTLLFLGMYGGIFANKIEGESND